MDHFFHFSIIFYIQDLFLHAKLEIRKKKKGKRIGKTTDEHKYFGK